jgi:tetratricopeptide (TPR) repeat protein
MKMHRSLLPLLITAGFFFCLVEAKTPDPERKQSGVFEEFYLPTGESLPRKAQEAFERGRQAAKRCDWSTAIREFCEVHKASPWSAPVLLNLGLAHAKAGHEAAAIAWLRAYLARVPYASNSASVRRDIARLHKGGIARIKAAFDGLERSLFACPIKEKVLGLICLYRAQAGDVSGAKRILKKHSIPAVIRQAFIPGACEDLAGEGRLKEALDLLETAGMNRHADSIRGAYCQHVISAGDLDAARKAAAEIRDSKERAPVLWSIAAGLGRRHVKEGNLAAALDIVHRHRNLGDLRRSLFQKYLEGEDFTGARRIADGVDRIPGKARYLTQLAIAYLVSGDRAAAKAVARDILPMGDAVISRDPFYREPMEDVEPLFVAHALLGNDDKARSFAERHRLGQGRDYAFGRVAFIQAMCGRIDGAVETARIARERGTWWKLGHPEAAIAYVSLAKGDIAKAAEKVERTGEWVKADLLAALARAWTAAGDLSRAEKALMEFPLTGHRELWQQHGKGDPRTVLVEMWLMQMTRLGRAYFDRQRYSDLFRVLNGARLVALDPRSQWPPELTPGIEQLAILQWQLGDRHAAWTTLCRAVPIEAKQWVYLAVSLSRSALDREKHLKELKGLKGALKKALEAGSAAKTLGEELRQIRSNERAFERARRRAPGAAPRTAQEYIKRGMARYFQGDLAGVLADFAKAVEMSPSLKAKVKACREKIRSRIIRRLGLRGKVNRGGGVLITEVRMGSISAKAGLKKGDVITSVRGRDATVESLAAAVGASGPGEGISVTVLRGTARHTVALMMNPLDTVSPTPVERDPQYTATFLLRARARFGRDDFNGSIRDCGKVIALDRTISEAYALRGKARRKKKDPDGAIADFNEALKLDPRQAEVHYLLGVIKAKKGDSKGAIPHYTRAIELDPRMRPAYFDRGIARRKTGDLEGAIGDYTHAIKLDARDEWVYLYRGIARTDTGDYEGAIADYTRLIELNPRSKSGYAFRSNAKARKGDFDGAIEDASKAIELDPKYGTAYYYRGRARRAKRDFDGAIADYTRGSMLHRRKARFIFARGCSYYGKGRWSEALADFRKAGELDPSERDASRLFIWLIRSRLGRRETATEALKAYVEKRRDAGQGEWLLEVASFVVGELSEKDLFNAAASRSSSKEQRQKCQAYFFAGSKRLLGGEKAAARLLFEKCLGTEARLRPEYVSAQVELSRLEGGR